MRFISNHGWNSIVPLHLRRYSDIFRLLSTRRTSDHGHGGTPVYLNVYDLTPVNNCVYWAGVGIFHSAIEVYGVEYAFGSHGSPTSGVYEVEPRRCSGFKFRKSIFMGMTCLDPIQVSELIEHHSANYNGDSYHSIVKNCNHFCDEICYELTGNRIPKWVNRLANIGSFCKCMIPRAPQVSAVRHSQDFQGLERKKGWSKLISVSVPDKKFSMSSLFRHSHYKGCLPPWELKDGIHQLK